MNVTPPHHDENMNEQLILPGKSSVWQLDNATRRRGRRGVARARLLLQESRMRPTESGVAHSDEITPQLVADAA